MPSNKLLSIALTIIIIMNAFLITEIGELNDRLQHLNNNYNNIQSNLNAISNNVNQSLDRFTREQSWITPVQINHDKSSVDTEQAQGVFNWQIKDYEEGSEVIFHYRFSDSDEFKTIAAQSLNPGFFEVSLPLEMKAEPSWEVHVSWSGENNAQAEQRVERAAIEEKNQLKQSLTCYVSMKNDDAVKSSEVSRLNFAYLAHMKYEPVQGHVHINDRKFNISIFAETSGSDNSLESVTAEFYNGNKLVARNPLQQGEESNFGSSRPEGSGIRDYHLFYDSGKEDISQVILEAKYKNGDIFRREIY